MALRALIHKLLKQRRRRAYTHIVSLGGSCRPSHQIARHFEFKQSYPFDGWITPLDSAAGFIENLEHDLYNPASLRERMKNGLIATIVNTEFQIKLFHDFKREGVRANVVPDWRSGIEKARSRTGHLVGKLQALNRGSSRVLFVRLSDNVSNKPLFGTKLTRRQATERLLMALRSRFDRISFDLMCVSFEQRLAKPEPSVIYIDMSDPADLLDPNDGWKGTNSLWSQAFDATGAHLEPPHEGGR